MEPSRIVVISDSFPTLPEAVDLLARSGHEITYVPALTAWPELSAEQLHALGKAQAVITGRGPYVDASQLALAPELRVIALHTSGCDNIDLENATHRSIIVTNVKGVNAEQCAEFAMGLTLCTVRQILTGDHAIRAGVWAERTQTSMDVFGSTIGVIGLGQIAKAFVRRARAFGAKILVYTRTPDPTLQQEFGIEYVSLDDLLRQSDIVALFASLTADSRHMLGTREIGLMKRSAYLVNIARGELIDEAALLEALRKRQIAGAGLDVFENEPVHASEFFALDNVVLTPHQAGLTQAGKTGAAVRAARNALEALRGSLPADAINPSVWAAKPTK